MTIQPFNVTPKSKKIIRKIKIPEADITFEVKMIIYTSNFEAASLILFKQKYTVYFLNISFSFLGDFQVMFYAMYSVKTDVRAFKPSSSPFAQSKRVNQTYIMATLGNFRFLLLFCKTPGNIQRHLLFNCTYFAFAGKRGNVIFAVNPASVEFQGKEGEEGVYLDHFIPVKEEIRFR